MANHHPYITTQPAAPRTFPSACAANDAATTHLDSDRVGNIIEYLLTATHHHRSMPVIAAGSLQSLGAAHRHASHAQICVDSLSTRAERVRASLRNSRSLAGILADSRPLGHALQPFLKPHPTSAYDAVAFLHSFGVAGPTDDQWHALFFASLAAHLRVEDLVVLCACAACGVTDLAQPVPECVATAIFGAAGLPSTEQKVCDLYDTWLLSEHFFERLLELHIGSAADGWFINVHDGGCTVRVGDGEWNIPDELCPTAVTDACAKIVVASVVPNIVHHVSLMISYGGRERVHQLLQCNLVQFLHAAVVHSKTVLYERILRAFEG